MKNVKVVIGSIFLIGLFLAQLSAQPPADWKEIGQLKTRQAEDIKSSTWSIGGETLDRDYTDYHSYKSYLGQLGAKRIRLQGGWAKCEKEKGKYSFEWLDMIIPDAAGRGVTPWVELSYGNPIYEGGGEAKLAGHIPHSEEALKAWDNWVRAMVNRYKGQVTEWEIWNEPDLNKQHTGKEIGEFYVRTAKIVREIQPKARLLALGLADVRKLDFVRDFMEHLKQNSALDLIDVLTYHGYAYNPDTSYPEIEKLRQLVWAYKPSIVFMQGENGAPSTPKAVTIGALRGQDWSELTQAKWDLRRMLGDHGRGIATNLFTISDIHYAANDHMVGVNTKGLLKTNPDKTIERPKIAFYAAQRVFSLFDENIVLDLKAKLQSSGANQSFFAYKHSRKGFSLISIWQSEEKPAETYLPKMSTLTIENGDFNNPVLVDLISGKIYEIPKTEWKKVGNTCTFNVIPVHDSPILIAEKKIISIQ
jgi:Glycosyl hydrolases family 39